LARGTRGPYVVGVAVLLAVGLSACGGDKEKKSGQALASVNGDEITVLQLNEELQRSGVAAAQQEAASKQLLQSLIDRQLLQNEAVKEKADRDPKVVQAIERAKALILAQSYMQKRVGALPRPTKAEVATYFENNPVYFSQRKTLELRQLQLATKDIVPEVKSAIDSAKSLDEVAAWLDSHKVAYTKAQLARATSELPLDLSSKLLAMPKGQLFMVREGERTVVSSTSEIRDTPVTLAASSTQIEQFLFNKKIKEASDAEIARLRASAKIEYLNKTLAPATAPAAAAAPAGAAASSSAASGSASANERGVAGLR
jgi:EpsD family peptidyl-prolyl cis-trans isomerase